MGYYPAFLDLSRRRCLLLGLGSVGRRKLATLRACGVGEVLVIETNPASLEHPEARELLAQPEVRLCPRPFTPEDLSRVSLAFAATGDRAANAALANACAERGIFCNVIDAPEEGELIVPASIRLDGLTLALSTHGASPALAKVLREDLERYLGERYAPLIELLGALRPLLLELGLPNETNADIFRSLARSAELREALAAPDTGHARKILAALLPEPLHPRLEELIHSTSRPRLSPA